MRVRFDLRSTHLSCRFLLAVDFLGLYTWSDRTSCHRWEANQFRLFLHSGAYWLLHQLRQAAPRCSLWRKATFETLRRAFLKIAVRIEELKSRVRVALPSAYPYRKAMISMAGLIAAQGP